MRRTRAISWLALSPAVFAAKKSYIYPAQGQSSDKNRKTNAIAVTGSIEEVDIDPLASSDKRSEPKKTRGRVLGGATVGGVAGGNAGDSD